MKKAIGLFFFISIITYSFAQTKKVELFDLVKKLVQDTTGYPTTGDWAVGKPATYPVKWKADKLEISDDMDINFFRNGTAVIKVKSKEFIAENKTDKWAVMLKGPRMGFSSFTITSPFTKDATGKNNIDSLLGGKNYTYTILKTCDKNAVNGFYYYKVKIVKKVTAWIKLSWTTKNDAIQLTLDCYDDWSQQYAKLNCPK